MAGLPPPYDSVIADNSGSFFTSAPSVVQAEQVKTSQFEISVGEPVKHGDGVGAYVVYKITTKTSHPSYSRPNSEVYRRFSHFSWLAQQLAEKHRGVIMPPLPEKSAVQKFQMSNDFIQQRRRALQVFLNKVGAHPVLKDDKALQQFLEAGEQEFGVEMARWAAEAAAAKPPPVTGALQWLKNLQHTASNMVARRSDDALEDAEYLKVRDYINSLEEHLSDAHRHAARLVRKEADLSAALADFGLAAEQLGKHDDGPVRGVMDILCARAGQIAAASKGRSEALGAEFEAPLKEAARTIKSVQAAMADRAAALAAYAQAKSDLDSKKVKLAKLRGTPGLKEQRIAEAEQEVTDAETRARDTHMAYDQLVSCMTEELNRFQKQRAAEMRALLQDFALSQAQAAADNAKAWSAMLADIQAQQAASSAAAQGGAAAAGPAFGSAEPSVPTPLPVSAPLHAGSPL